MCRRGERTWNLTTTKTNRRTFDTDSMTAAPFQRFVSKPTVGTLYAMKNVNILAASILAKLLA
jgi:hypothetical protein